MRVVEAARQTVALKRLTNVRSLPNSCRCRRSITPCPQLDRTGRAPVMGRSKPAEKICVSMKRLRSTRRAMIEDLQLIPAVIRATGLFELRR